MKLLLNFQKEKIDTFLHNCSWKSQRKTTPEAELETYEYKKVKR